MSTNDSTTKIALRLLLGVAVLTASLWGAGFWDKKDFVHWTGKDLEKMFRNSPWAKKVSVAMGPPVGGDFGGGGGASRRGGGGGGAPGGGAYGGGGGAGGAGGGRRGGGGGGGMPTAPPPMDLLVRFDEAMPVKEAKVKYRLGESTVVPPEFQQYLDEVQDYYVVSVEGLPQFLARFAEEPERLATTARLRRKSKDDIYPAKVEVRAEGSVVFRYYFVKADPIELADKEVEFFMKLDRPQGALAGGRGQGQGGPRQGAGQRPSGGQGGQGGQGQRGAQGAGRGSGGGGAGAAMARMLFGKEIKKKFRLKDMVYKGELAL